MSEIFRKIFGSDYLYCARNSLHPSDDNWKCIGGFDSYMDADNFSSKWNLFQYPTVSQDQTVLIKVPNILPRIVKVIVLERKLKRETRVYYKHKDILQPSEDSPQE